MSAFDTTLKAIREVILLQSRVERLEHELKVVEDDIRSLVKYTNELSSRVVHMEGFIQGAAAGSSRRARLPRA